MQQDPEDRSLENFFDGESEDSGWYFDLPQGAWERQQQKSRELRQSVRSKADDIPEIDRPEQEKGARKGLLSFGRKPEQEDEEGARLIAGGKWMLNRDPDALKELRPLGDSEQDADDDEWTPDLPLALPRSGAWETAEQPAQARDSQTSRLRWADAFAGSGDGNDPLAPMSDWPGRSNTNEPAAAENSAEPGPGTEPEAPPPLPLRLRSERDDNAETEEVPARTSRWEEVFSGSVDEGSIVDAMRNWASGNMNTGDSANQNTPREVPPEFLQPFDWELEDGKEESAGQPAEPAAQDAAPAASSDPAPAREDQSNVRPPAFGDWVQVPDMPGDEPEGASWDELARVPTFEADTKDAHPRRKRRGFFARLFNRKAEDEPEPTPLPEADPADGDWVPVDHVPEPRSGSSDDTTFVPRWVNPALSAARADESASTEPANGEATVAPAASIEAEPRSERDSEPGVKERSASPAPEPALPSTASVEAPPAQPESEALSSDSPEEPEKPTGLPAASTAEQPEPHAAEFDAHPTPLAAGHEAPAGPVEFESVPAAASIPDQPPAVEAETHPEPLAAEVESAAEPVEPEAAPATPFIAEQTEPSADEPETQPAPLAAEPKPSPEPVEFEPAPAAASLDEDEDDEDYTSDITAIAHLFKPQSDAAPSPDAEQVEEAVESSFAAPMYSHSLDSSDPMPSNDVVNDPNQSDNREPTPDDAPDPNLLQFPAPQPPPEASNEEPPPNVVELHPAAEEDDDPWAAFIAARRAAGESFPKGDVPADEDPAGRDDQFSREEPGQEPAPVDEPVAHAEPADPASAWAHVFSQLDEGPAVEPSPADTTRADTPLADEQPTEDDPWADVAAASGFAGAPGDVAVYRGTGGHDEPTFEPGTTVPEAASEERPHTAPLWKPEEPDEDDVVLRAFYEHANAETEPEEPESPAEEEPASPADDAAFEPLLGRDAAELIDEASGGDEPQSFLRPQAAAPRPVPPLETDGWVGATDDEPSDWDGGGGGDSGYVVTSFYEPEEPSFSEPAESSSTGRTKMLVREIVETALLALLVFLCVRASFQNFRVSGESMYPTLDDGQFVIVNKLVYSEIDLEKLSRFLPFIDPGDDPKKHVFHGPERGDIIVLQDPRPDHEEDLIKRVIALPGERIGIQNGQVYINGYRLIEPYITEPWNDNMPEIQLGKDEYFVMGDNRRNSLDSRSGTVGLIHEDLIIGKAMFSYWPTSHFGFAPNASPKLEKPELSTERIGD